MRLLCVTTGLSAFPGFLAAQTQCQHQPLTTHRAHYCVTGSGAPTIVLAAGAGSTSRTWDELTRRLEGIGTIVSFDRAGLGMSSSSSASRTPTQIASELRELLDVAGLEGPFVLVGHSAGGWHALRFVEQFPAWVAGIVLVDTPPVGFEAKRLELLPPQKREERVRMLAERDLGAPAIVRDERRDTQADIATGFTQLPKELPLVVLAADGQDFGDARTEQAHRDLWVSMSREWLGLAPGGRFIVARGSTHMIHHDEPQLLADLIRSLVARAVSP